MLGGWRLLMDMSPILFSDQQLVDAIAPMAKNSFVAISKLAALQHGVVSREQAKMIGCEGWWIDEEMKRGHLIAVADGIYAVGHVGLSRRGRAVCALLRAGDGSAISHDSAARAWEVERASTDGPIHLSLGRRRGLSHADGIRVHRPRTLQPDEIVVHRGLPVTTPERTLRDLLPTRSVVQITRFLEQLVTTLGRSPDQLHAWAAELPRRTPGHSKLMLSLETMVGPAVLRSELEGAFRSLCQSAGLPLPETNVRVGNWEVDALWRELMVAVELDSWRFHGGHWQFHQDRRKGLALSREGFELIRLTWPQVKHAEDEVVRTLRLVLDRASSRR